MIKPKDINAEEWRAFGEFARTQGVDPNDHADDVQPWLDFWRAGVAWAEREV